MKRSDPDNPYKRAAKFRGSYVESQTAHLRAYGTSLTASEDADKVSSSSWLSNGEDSTPSTPSGQASM
eukprot:5707851-Pleurochrysis_carterae.AAC.1